MFRTIRKALATALIIAAATLPAFADDPSSIQRDISYGSHPENLLDFYRADGDGPRPLLVYIHGGGWRGGKKDQNAKTLDPFLERGISVASITYRFTPEHPLPAPVHDAARALQFLRSKATEWNIDSSRIALSGVSAGACTSMWLLLHDDLSDPTSSDPVARESTRVIAAAARAGQTSIDPEQIVPWLGPKVLDHLMIANSVGEPTTAAALENYSKHAATYHEFSPINHVTSDDPALFMSYSLDADLPSRDAGHGIHHPLFGIKLKEKCDELGVECHLQHKDQNAPGTFANATEFLLQKLAPAR